MKTLFLVRHAKSSWKHPELSDRDRPLNQRGLADTPRMGKRLAARQDVPELIVSSPANRALTTAWMLAAEIGFDPADVMVDEDIYGADPEDLLDIISGFPNHCERAMLVGHNPTLTELTNQLTGAAIDNIPTCGIAVIYFATTTWTTIEDGKGQLLEFDYPKKVRSET
jgi:phosphohistidine phosphatase